jgi:ATP-dependent Lon protease
VVIAHAALGVICDAARGPDADRHDSILISLTSKGSRHRADLQCAGLLTDLRCDLIRRAASRHGAFSLAPILLLGPPGLGKSRFVRALGETFEVPFRRVDRAGKSDARDFLGNARGWSGEAPAMPTVLLGEITVANPVVLIDELDKETVDSRNDSVARGLLAMLEPETARRWRDPCLGAEIDLSHIAWVLAAIATRLA